MSIISPTLHCLPRHAVVGVPLESALNLVSRTSPCGAYDTHYTVLGVTITCSIGYDRVDDTCISTCISTYSNYVRLRAPLLDGVHTKKIREREQKPAPQKPPSQTFSSNLPGRENARTFSTEISAPHLDVGCPPPPPILVGGMSPLCATIGIIDCQKVAIERLAF